MQASYACLGLCSCFGFFLCLSLSLSPSSSSSPSFSLLLPVLSPFRYSVLPPDMHGHGHMAISSVASRGFMAWSLAYGGAARLYNQLRQDSQVLGFSEWTALVQLVVLSPFSLAPSNPVQIASACTISPRAVRLCSD